jgi:acyloxyacyl hydrolase
MSVQRDQQNDQPLLVFFALIGNDVCNGHPGMDHMTNVTAFHDNVLASLQFLDTKVRLLLRARLSGAGNVR